MEIRGRRKRMVRRKSKSKQRVTQGEDKWTRRVPLISNFDMNCKAESSRLQSEEWRVYD